MGRIIIDNRSSVSDSYVVGLVQKVIDQGRISNNDKQYCYGSRFPYIGVVIFTDLNKCSDRFIAVDEKEKWNEQ